MRTEKPGISLPLDTIRASLDAAAADPMRHCAAAVSTHFDRLRDQAEKTPDRELAAVNIYASSAGSS